MKIRRPAEKYKVADKLTKYYAQVIPLSKIHALISIRIVRIGLLVYIFRSGSYESNIARLECNYCTRLGGGGTLADVSAAIFMCSLLTWKFAKKGPDQLWFAPLSY